jgi:S1-C subfamily serine protease/antitoxin component YwqK of YwqJK toxin-antitoxin module
MLKRINLLIALFMIIINSAFSQNEGTKVYFDKAGKATDESLGYYYRQKTDKPNEYVAYYVNGGSLFFEGKIKSASDSDEGLNVYNGNCTWYYKNGKKKSERSFNNDGVENGTSVFYYESGKIWKEIEYANGKLANNSYKEYDEDGQVSKIFEEDFNNNFNDWDLYTSDKNSSSIAGGLLSLTSFTKEGASRYISVPSSSEEFALEAIMNIDKLKGGEKAGLIFGFKDWQNYNFFLITNSSFYIGFVYEGVSSLKTEGMYSSDIRKDKENNIKIISNGEKNVYSINGIIQFKADRTRNFGSNIGFAVSGKSTITIDKMIYKDIDYKSIEATSTNSVDRNVKATGSGLVFTTNGYIITNHHVIDNANKIIIEMSNKGVVKSYNAVVVQKDIDNDIALLKIKDETFEAIDPIRYSFKESGSADVGASVFTIGFPYALSGMGKEAKFTDGKISSKTGYNGAINSYQTSIPVQPGNSGGPLFNDKGQLIGIINSKITGADNVSYAIKLNYVKNVIELLSDAPVFPNDQNIAAVTTEEKVKVLSDYVVLIKIK